MLENLITKTDKFEICQVDHDIINESKSYFSIYNNKITKPFHNFWFMLTNTKFFNEYNDYNIIRFGLNHSSNEVIKFINFFKDLSTHLKNIFSKVFENISLDYPWKEYENYPYLFSLFLNDDTIVLDEQKNIIMKNKIEHKKSYSILFEIKNIKVVKIDLDNEISHQIKFTLSALMIQQEQEVDLKSYLLNSLNINKKSIEPIQQNNYEVNDLNKLNNKPNIPFLSELSNGFKNLNKMDHVQPKNKIINTINLDELLSIKSSLKKVIHDENNNIGLNLNLNSNSNSISNSNIGFKSQNNSDDEISKIGNTYLNKKKQLKKTITEEKSLFNNLVNKNKKDNKNKITIDSNNDLEKELEEMENSLNIKNNISKKDKKKIKKKDKKKMELEDLKYLEQELDKINN